MGMAMIGPHWTTSAPGFFKALELAHGRQQRPTQALLQTHVAFTPRSIGFQADPTFEHTVIERRLTFEFPLPGTNLVEARFKHVTDGRLAFQGHQVPAEKQQVTPVTLLRKQFQRAVQITLGETLAEVFDPGGELGSWRLQRGFDSDVHGASPDLVVVVTIALEQGSGHLHESPVTERLAQYRPGCGADSCHDFGNGG
ncbi:hypothetical protein D3C73_1049810 [compost metagenome]